MPLHKYLALLIGDFVFCILFANRTSGAELMEDLRA